MQLSTSKQLAMLAVFMLFAFGYTLVCIPIPLPSKLFILLAFSWFWWQQCLRLVLLRAPTSLSSLSCDDQHIWSLDLKHDRIAHATLASTSVVCVHWMFLVFVSQQVPSKSYCFVLAADSFSKKDWRLLQCLVRFAKPVKDKE